MEIRDRDLSLKISESHRVFRSLATFHRLDHLQIINPFLISRAFLQLIFYGNAHREFLQNQSKGITPL